MGQSAEHVAIIMDGNGRWAQQRGLPRLAGHHEGAKRIREIVQACPSVGVKHLTIFAFSTENWKRTQVEVGGLMRLFKRYILREAQDLVNEGVRVRFIGDRLRLDKTLIRLMDELEALTAQNAKVHLTIALNYGGRDEVTRAAQRMAGGCGERQAGRKRGDGGGFGPLFGYAFAARSRFGDPHQRRSAHFQFPSVAVRLCGI